MKKEDLGNFSRRNSGKKTLSKLVITVTIGRTTLPTREGPETEGIGELS